MNNLAAMPPVTAAKAGAPTASAKDATAVKPKPKLAAKKPVIKPDVAATAKTIL